MRRVRRYMALARRRREPGRLARIAALPVAGFIAIVSVQLAILSAEGRLTLDAAAPMIWLAITFTGLLAVFMSMNQR